MSCRTYRARTTRITARHGRLDPLTQKYIRSRKHITELETYAIVAAHESAYASGKLNYTADPRLLCRDYENSFMCEYERLSRRYRWLVRRSRKRKMDRDSSYRVLDFFFNIRYGHFYKCGRSVDVRRVHVCPLAVRTQNAIFLRTRSGPGNDLQFVANVTRLIHHNFLRNILSLFIILCVQYVIIIIYRFIFLKL